MSLAGLLGLVSIQPAAGRSVLIGVENDMIHQREIQINTSGHRQMHDLTDEVGQIVTASHVTAGLVHIFNARQHGGDRDDRIRAWTPGRPASQFRQDLPAEPRLWARTSLARWQWPFAPAGDDAGSITDSAHQKRKASLGNLAADLSSGMRHQTPPADDRDHRHGRALARLLAHYRPEC